MLSIEKAQEYWAERAERYGGMAVGFNCEESVKQELHHRERAEHIFTVVSRNIPTLDYGCGIGRFCKEFKYYVGADMTKRLIDIAKYQNPQKTFIWLPEPWLGFEATTVAQSAEQVFTCTVLQHCSNELVMKIFESIKELKQLTVFSLYEKNNDDTLPHVISRTSNQYVDLMKEVGWNARLLSSSTHTIHNELHTLSVIEVN